MLDDRLIDRPGVVEYIILTMNESFKIVVHDRILKRIFFTGCLKTLFHTYPQNVDHWKLIKYSWCPTHAWRALLWAVENSRSAAGCCCTRLADEPEIIKS